MTDPYLGAIVASLFSWQIDPFSIAVIILIVGPWLIVIRSTRLKVKAKAIAISAFGFLFGGVLYAPSLLASYLGGNPTITWLIVTGSQALNGVAAQYSTNNLVGGMILSIPTLGFMAWFTRTGQDWPRELKEFVGYLVVGAIGLLVLSFFV